MQRFDRQAPGAEEMSNESEAVRLKRSEHSEMIRDWILKGEDATTESDAMIAALEVAAMEVSKLQIERDRLKANNAELSSVMGLLRLHRNGSDGWDEPVSSDLLSREDQCLEHQEPKG